MKKSVRVFVHSAQQYDDYADQITTNSVGEYTATKNVHTIIYCEKMEGDNLVNNTLTLKKDGAVLDRTGAVTSRMVFDSGKTTDAEYITAYGDMAFRINTTRYDARIEEEHINVLLQYDLIHDCQKVSKNILQISIEIQQP